MPSRRSVMDKRWRIERLVGDRWQAMLSGSEPGIRAAFKALGGDAKKIRRIGGLRLVACTGRVVETMRS